MCWGSDTVGVIPEPTRGSCVPYFLAAFRTGRRSDRTRQLEAELSDDLSCSTMSSTQEEHYA